MGQPQSLVGSAEAVMNPLHIALMVWAYAVASIPFGFLIGRWARVDVQKEGSGNIGATNVARTAGKGLGLLTLFLDAGKGALAVATPFWVGWPEGAGMCAVLGVVGHVFPVWLKFKGGKGVATAAGALLVLNISVAGAAVAVFVVVFALVRVVGLASVAAAVSLPLFAWLFDGPPSVQAATAMIAVIVIVRHVGNLQRAFKRD